MFATGDLFDMLLPMLGIYQEYVRNHHYSLQVRHQSRTVSHQQRRQSLVISHQYILQVRHQSQVISHRYIS